MSVARFRAATTREALQQVRAALGEDALVLANRATTAGVEILALASLDAERMADVSAMGGATLGERLLGELAAMRARLDAPRTSAPPPAHVALWRRLRAAGFSAELSQSLLTTLPEHPVANWLAPQLCVRVQVAAAAALADVRVIVVLGADGEAKAALAAHFAQARGTDNLTLINADVRRAGSREQIAAQLAALHVDLPVVAADGTLEDILATRDAARRAIIVAPALGTADPWTQAQVQAACGLDGATPLLLLDAARQPEALEREAVAYRAATAEAGTRLTNACISGCDAAPRLGPALDVVIRYGLTLHAIMGSRGWSHPADAGAIDAAALVSRALAATGADAPVGPPPQIHQLLRQGRALGDALSVLRQRATGFDVAERAWSGRRLAPALQEQYAAGALALAAGPATAWRWYSARTAGGRAQGLDAAGLPLPGAIVYAPLGSMLPALAISEARMASAMHLLPDPPDGAEWHWLAAHAQPWIASARGRAPVWHAGTRVPLADCRASAHSAGDAVLHLGGRGVHLSLRCAPVALDLRGTRTTAVLDAWFADLRDRATGTPLPARCGLLPRALAPKIALQLVGLQLQTETLVPLAAFAQRQLAALRGTLAGEATRLAADSLAALACRLDGEVTEWALQLRIEMQNLAGSHGGRGAKPVLANLITLLATRDALREIGVPAWQVQP